MKQLAKFVFFALVVAMPSMRAMFAQDVLFVAANNVNLFKEPSQKSNKLTGVPVGTKLVAKSTKGMWINVTYKKNTGWVHKIYLSADNPQQEKRGFLSVFNSMVSKMRGKESVRKRATVMGVRGLDEEGKVDNLDIEPNMDAVNRIDQSFEMVDQKRIDKFLANIK